MLAALWIHLSAAQKPLSDSSKLRMVRLDQILKIPRELLQILPPAADEQWPTQLTDAAPNLLDDRKG